MEGIHSKPRATSPVSRISAARLAAGMTQGQLAEIVGCKQRDISRWESGQHWPEVRTAIKIARALGKTTEDLFGE